MRDGRRTTGARGWLRPRPLIAAATALASLISALTPDMAWRGHVVKDMGLVQVAAVFHAAVVPLATALLLASYYLWRRRRRAFAVAFVLLIAIGVFNVLKGLDVEEALLAWIGAGSPVVGPRRLHGRARPGQARCARSPPRRRLWRSRWRVTFVAAWSAAKGRPDLGLVARATGDMFLWQDPPMRICRQPAIRARRRWEWSHCSGCCSPPARCFARCRRWCRCPTWPSAPAPPT